MGLVQEDYTREEALTAVGPGWADIVRPLWDMCKAQRPPIDVVQVKEKFGGLRFYTGGGPQDKYDGVYDAINAAEVLSYLTCEDCGAPGEPREGGWIRTLCDDHANGAGPLEDK